MSSAAASIGSEGGRFQEAFRALVVLATPNQLKEGAESQHDLGASQYQEPEEPLRWAGMWEKSRKAREVESQRRKILDAQRQGAKPKYHTGGHHPTS